jgi:hypothetical protein
LLNVANNSGTQSDSSIICQPLHFTGEEPSHSLVPTFRLVLSARLHISHQSNRQAATHLNPPFPLLVPLATSARLPRSLLGSSVSYDRFPQGREAR